ncbi:phage tail tape measure protein [Consotaella aegiceratis]|uniref:phage tail tape measure protein n=1 Tax=Consotaella aegiceratis TaxID=3097961 RepID=UPI002F421EE7
MAADLAMLALGVDSSEVVGASKDLDRIKEAAKKAEGAADSFGSKANAAGKKAAAANDNAARSAERLSRVYDVLRGKMVALGAAAVASIAAAFTVGPVFAFQDALAEVSTLVDTTKFDMRGLADAALEQSTAFGGSPAQQVKAYYQIISAGASSAAEATDILTAANKLAVGGVTDVATAADGLTSVLNAYGDQVDGAASVSDALFVGMRAGKTTIGELSGALGRVAPLAAQTGVQFDELVASVAALTKGGISTAESVTGVRAILAAVAKPTSEASKLAKQLGIDFSIVGLQAKGFEGFLSDLVTRTHGNTDALAQLFGGVEALVPILALSGQAGEDFTAILEQMADKAGATEDAFSKMANSPGFQAGRVWSALQAEITGVGSTMSGAFVTALKAVADNMHVIVGLVEVVGAGLLAAFAPAILAAMATGLTAIGAAGVAAISAITVAIAANPLGALLVAITTIITALYVFRDDIERVFGVDVIGEAEDAANRIIGAFVGGYDVVKRQWENLPTLFSALGKEAWNNLISEFEKPWLSVNGKTWISGLDMSGMKAKLTDEEKASRADATATFNEAFYRDYTGAAGASITGDAGTAEDSLAKIKKAADEATGSLGLLGDAGDKAGKKTKTAAEKAAESYADIVQGAQQFIASQQLEAETLGMTDRAANALRYEQEMLNKAANDNITLTAAQRDELAGLALQMSATEAATKAAKEAFSFARDLVGGFVQDLRQGLQNGEGFWKSFGNAALGVLDKIVDKLLNNVLDALFQVNTVGASGGGGGLLGSLLGLFGGGNTGGLYASGGYTGNGATNAAAGIVHGQEYVFSAAATRAIGVRNLDALHGAAKGYAGGGYVAPVSPRMQAPANQESPNITLGGTSIVVNGNADAATVEDMRTLLAQNQKDTLSAVQQNFGGYYREAKRRGKVR